MFLTQDDAEDLKRLTAEAKGRRAILRVGEGDHAASRDAHDRADPAVLAASEEVRLQALDREEIYSWVEATLRAQQYEKPPKALRGLLLHYLVKMTGLIPIRFLSIMRRSKLADAGGFECEHHGRCRKALSSAWRPG